MLILLSPAKKQVYNDDCYHVKGTQPQAKNQTKILVETLKKLTATKIATLMSVSANIADLNYHRYQDFNPASYTLNNAKPAIYAFHGDAYKALDANTLDTKSITFAQEHLIILSGLYGYLRPLDLIQPYRLEMKTPLKNPKGSDLYAFWADKINQGINKACEKIHADIIINLASSEYFKALNPDRLTAKIITVHFKDFKNGTYKVIGINAKRARGAMTRYIIENQLNNLKSLQKFTANGYTFNRSLSDTSNLVFTKEK